MSVSEILEKAGMSGAEASAKEARFSRAERSLELRATPGEKRVAWFVPGRVEVLGKHTDYAGGRTLVCAAERGFCVTAAGRPDDRVTITDSSRDSTFATALGAAGGRRRGNRWFTYPATVVRRIARNFPSARRGADIVFESDLPSAAGMSSSSALMIAVLLALVDLNDLERDDQWTRWIHTREDLASYAATVENGSTFGALEGDRGVGTAGGSEDHTAILCGKAGFLSQYSFCPVRFERVLPVPRGLVFAVGVSGIVANKIGAAREQYNSASRAVGTIVERWNHATGRADSSLAAAVASGPEAADRIRAIIRDSGPEPSGLLDRFEQFLAESEEIVPRAGNQLAQGDLAGFGASVDRSQALADRLLGNQVPETIELALEARACGAYAASAFGAGFGGSVWALIEEAAAQRFLDAWSRSFRARFPSAGERARFFVTRPGPAATRLTP